MINDTPKSPKQQTTQTFKPASKPDYDGGFHIAAAKPKKNTANKRSSSQVFTCGW